MSSGEVEKEKKLERRTFPAAEPGSQTRRGGEGKELRSC